MDVKQMHQFLSGLTANNSKEWMESNKSAYQATRQDFVELVSTVLKRIDKFDPGMGAEDPKKCVFRLNRDIRFSANKDPYKTHYGAYMAIGGRTSGHPGFYMHIMPGQNFCGGGLYHPEAEALKKVRQEIDYNKDEFLSMVNNKQFASTFKAYDDQLKTAPKGYPKDHPNIEWLKYKSYAFTQQFSDKEAQSDDFIDQVINSFKTLKPMVDFLRRGLD